LPCRHLLESGRSSREPHRIRRRPGMRLYFAKQSSGGEPLGPSIHD
jgi:hypothetical protein